MIAVKATIHNRRIELNAPEEFPDGTELLVELTPISSAKIGIDESEWRDDPAALADWEAWIQTIEPPELTPEEEANSARFNVEMKRFNIEAIRKHMSEDPAP